MVKIFKGDVLKHGDPSYCGGYYFEMPDTVSLQDYQSLQFALRGALELAVRVHFDCEDCFYSCSTLCCDDNRRDKPCDCGADKINARIAELRTQFLDDK